MSKPKSKPKSESDPVYSRIHHLERELGTTRSTPGAPKVIQTNARPLEAFIPKSQLRTTERCEWSPKTNKVTVHKDPVDVLEYAQRHTSRIKLSNPATSGERQRYREAEVAKVSDNKNRSGMCAPSCCGGDWGKPGSPSTATVLAGGSKRRY